MLRSAFLVAFFFLLGAVSAGTVQAHRIISTPLMPVVTEAPVDARSVCALASSISGVPDCRAFPWTKSIGFNLEVSPADAGKVCAAIASRTSEFDGMGWTIRIYSAFSVSPIASCPL